MMASKTEFMPSGPEPDHSSRRLPDSRQELLRLVRSRHPELQPEDAFVVPSWFGQQKKWVEDPTGSDSAIYNYPLLLRIRGPLRERALQQSLQEIVRRHGVLRSVFRVMDESLIQIVVAAQEFSLPLTHLAGLPEARERQMQEAARAEAMRPFDLTRDPLLRARLMCLETEDHVLQLTTHTLVYDDWSSGALIHDLSEMYGAFAAGTIPLHHPLPFQFGDFVRWHRKRLQGPEFESHLGYWKQQLDSATAFEHLPADFARPSSNAHTGARQTVILPVAQADSLKLLSRQERVSLFMVLLAGFKCLLHRYSGHEEIGVATCAANRPLEEVEGLIGRFGNSVLLRTSLSGNPTFSELLKRVREVTLKAFSHQELPFGMLLERISGGADGNRKPPFQVMFILQNAPKESWQLPGLSVEWAPLATGTSKYDLIVWLKSEPKLEITLEYSTQVFASASMNQLFADYQAILETMAKDPKERVNTVRISAKPESVGAKPAPTPVKEIVGVADKAGVEARMIELWKAAFGLHTIDVSQNFFELGGDSLLAARLFAQIEKAFQRPLPLTSLLEAPTIQQLVQILCDEASGPSSTLVSVQPKGTRPPLFCVHGHGGEPFYCRELSRSLGSDQPLYGLRSQGHCGEPIHHTVSEMAAHYTQVIRAVQPNGPYYLGGYCFGGMIAYEMARLLTAQNQDIALLALFNTPAPGSLRGWPLNLNYIKRRSLHELTKLRAQGTLPKLRILGIKSARLLRLAWRSYKAVLGRLIAKLSHPSAKPLTNGLLSVPGANIAAAKAYDPGRYAGRITLFSTREVSTYYGIDPREGWLPFAAGGIEHHAVEGDHDSLFEPPFDAMVAAKLKRCLERASDPNRVAPMELPPPKAALNAPRRDASISAPKAAATGDTEDNTPPLLTA
jgi:thioesterase domain-containing protein/acyl carrier protein